MKKNTNAIVTIDNNMNPSFILRNTDISKKSPKVTLIANTHRTVIRVAPLSKQNKRLTPKIKWRLVQEHFPLGVLLCENTHYFDGCVITGVNEDVFLMVALPQDISQAITNMALEEWGSIHRINNLETMEDLLFRHFSHLAKNQKRKPTRFNSQKRVGSCSEDVISGVLPQWIIFPQDDGYKVLYMDKGLPCGAYYISNREGFREAELNRVWEIAAAHNILVMGCDETDALWIKEFIQGRDHSTTILTGIKYPSIIGL